MFTALSQVPGLLPVFETKKALIIINLQNDSLYCKGDLYITKNHEFVDRIKTLVPRFRKIGEIIWVRTEMGTRSFPTSPGSAYIEEEVAKIDQKDQKNREEQKMAEERLEDDTAVNADDEPKAQQPNLESGSTIALQTYHPTSRSQAMMKRASAKARADQRTANMDIFNDKEDVFEEHVKPRKGQQPKFYIGGTKGAEIADELLSVVDESRDMILIKNHYSAFDQTSLLMSLRMNLVTDVYLCGCLTNVGVYATAADAVQHGLSVTVVEDCLGYRSEDKHEESMRQMADIMGVNGIDSEEFLEEAKANLPPDYEEPPFSGPGPEGVAGLDRLSIHVSSPETELAPDIPAETNAGDAEAAASPTNQLGAAATVDAELHPISTILADPAVKAEDLNLTGGTIETDAARRSTSLPDGLTQFPSPNSSSGMKRDSWMSASTSMEVLSDHLGTGDSRIIHDALSSRLADDAFQLLKEEVLWQTMHHRSGKVPRLVAVQGEVGQEGIVPIYRHPTDESPRLRAFSPTVERIRREVEEMLDQPFNHALIQLYRDGNDNISEHADKVSSFGFVQIFKISITDFDRHWISFATLALLMSV